MKRLERLVSMALVLASRRRLRASDLARQFGISDRTVYRDMGALQRAGFPLEGNAGDGYRVSPQAFLRPLAFDESEAAALAMAAQFLGASADPPLRESLATATAKLESVLSAEARARVRRQRAGVHVSASGSRPAGPLGMLSRAVDVRKVVHLDYHPESDGPPTQRDVEPLGLVRTERAWLLVAYCRLRQDVRAFRVDRIQKATLTGEFFEPRPSASFAEVIERERQRFSGS
jgi:predicted DNA-binding transcriptional regulator YafY